MRITVPRWAQFILIPIAIFLALYFGRAAGHAVFVFLISSIVALLLNPLVLGLNRIKFPRWLGVPLVYLSFLGVVVVFFVFVGPPLVRQFQRLFEAIPGWLDSLNSVLGLSWNETACTFAASFCTIRTGLNAFARMSDTH